MSSTNPATPTHCLRTMVALLLGLAAGRGALAQVEGPLPTSVDLVSGSAAAGSSNQDSIQPDVSADGGVIVFTSSATNLIAADTDRISDIYSRDLVAGRLSLVSVSTAFPGAPALKGNRDSRSPSVDARGAAIVFSSFATNLVPADSNGASDIFLHRLEAATTTILSQSDAGVAGDGDSSEPEISDDGSVVVYESLAGNLASPAIAAGVSRVYIREVARGTSRVSGLGGAAPDGPAHRPQPSGDGRWVAFDSTATNLVAGDQNGVSDVFLLDRVTGTITRVSVTDRGAQVSGPSTSPRISADGRLVAFESTAADLVADHQGGVTAVFVKDLQTGAVERVSPGLGARAGVAAARLDSLSGDGRIVAFTTVTALLPRDGNGVSDVYLLDRPLGALSLLSAALPAAGDPAANSASNSGALSADGRRAAFASTATNLSRLDLGPESDVYAAAFDLVPLGPFAPSPHILAVLDGSLRQLDPGGVPTGRSVALASPLASYAVDERNALWVLTERALSRYEALSLLPAGGRDAEVASIEGARRHGLVAAGGGAWVAVDDRLLHVSPSGETVTLRLAAVPESVALALDPFGEVWVSAAFARGNLHELYKANSSTGLRRLHVGVLGLGAHDAACDARGSLLLRTGDSLQKHSVAGALLWSTPIDGGGGVAVVAGGSAFTLAREALLEVDARGQVVARAPAPGLGRSASPARLFSDGLQDIYVAEDGTRSLFRLHRGARPGLSLEAFGVGSVRSVPADPAGFAAAHVSGRAADSDADGLLNGPETDEGFHPFDAASPGAARRLPGVLELTAEAEGARGVRLRWRSPLLYRLFYVFRDGRPMAGSPFPFSAAFEGALDTDAPGGFHLYRVIGQGASGVGGGARGGGAAFDPGTDDIEEPFSLSQEAGIALGEGNVVDSVSTYPFEPDAVAFSDAPGAERVWVALGGGRLWSLHPDLTLASEDLLPANPFAAAEVRGLAVDRAAPARPLYLLLADGRVYSRTGGADPLLVATLAGGPATPEGYSGLALASPGGSDLFTTMAGPGVDCLIGFLRSTGAFQNGADANLSATLDASVLHSIGLSRIGGQLLAGVGFDVDPPPPTVDRVVKLDLGPAFALGNAGAGVSLLALGSSDIAAFDHAPGLGLFVADRSGQRIARVEASFPGAVKVLSVTPPRGPRDAPTPDVVIAGTGFGNDPDLLEVRFDGFPIPIQSLQGGTTIVVDAPPLGEARAVEVSVSTLQSTGALPDGFIYGFRRGDANDDKKLDISDGLAILGFLFTGGAAPPCLDAADANDSETIDLSDAVYVLGFLFLGGVAPPPPFTAYGLDPVGGLLDCKD